MCKLSDQEKDETKEKPVAERKEATERHLLWAWLLFQI
jgi:hypothetical protein